MPPINGGVEVFTEENIEQIETSKILEKKKRKKYKTPKLVFNLMYTTYPLIKRVAKQLNFKVTNDDISLVPPAPDTEEYFLR